MPPGMDIVTFLCHDGKPPDTTRESSPPDITFAQLRDGHLKTIGNGSVDKNTLYISKIHLAHQADTLGERFPIVTLAHADLQRHVIRRCAAKTVAAITIKKELDTLRSAWNWAKRMGYTQDEFPGAGLVYPKGEEKLPFMTWTEIERPSPPEATRRNYGNAFTCVNRKSPSSSTSFSNGRPRSALENG